MKYVCIHGHFYQPPRENPWLEAVEPQDEAAPYHDWNERINAECYAPNTASRILDDRDRIVDIVNNYGRISFDFGPTLLAWMEERAPEVYRAVLDADRESRERFQGHGSAMAQAYNHVILPLASREDKEIQVAWGIRDFELRFGRSPEGMWLPETAVDIETLETLAAHEIRFTILAPSQAARVRPVGASEWQDVSGARIDPTLSYVQRLPSGRSIALFFYDGAASRAVAFERLLHRGENLARTLTSLVRDDGRPRLGHIATDGETYGHHHPHGDMALAFALRAIETQALATVTNYGAFLDVSPPAHEVEIVERTSWSCVHGVERWRSNCGCRTGGAPGWSQAWRVPLRESLDWLRLRVAPHLRRAEQAVFQAPAKAVLEYVELILDRSVDSVDRFLARHARPGPLSPEERVKALKLLELERQLQLMYTSCGWFFSDVSGIETVQILRYSGRAVQLARDLFHSETESLEREFLELLGLAKSNRPEMGSARELYQRNVKPSQATFESIAAHYAIASLFEPYPERARLYCYEVERSDSLSRQAGKTRLLSGCARITSRVTRASARLVYAVLHLGGHTVTAGVKKLAEGACHPELGRTLEKPFEKGDSQSVLRLIDREFGPEVYDLKSLFGDEQRRVVGSLLRTTLEEAETALGQLYEHHGATMRFLADLGVPPPRALSVASEVMINSYLRRALAADTVDESEIASFIRDAAMEGISLDAPTLAFTARRSLELLAESFFDAPEDFDALARLRKKVKVAISMPFEVELWKVQNMYFHAMKRLLRQALPRSWRDEFLRLGDDLSLWIPDRP
jgi:alpha-amylase/alpha-mannosidase (GH57 family)